jgi:hypothetical protein
VYTAHAAALLHMMRQSRAVLHWQGHLLMHTPLQASADAYISMECNLLAVSAQCQHMSQVHTACKNSVKVRCCAVARLQQLCSHICIRITPHGVPCTSVVCEHTVKCSASRSSYIICLVCGFSWFLHRVMLNDNCAVLSSPTTSYSVKLMWAYASVFCCMQAVLYPLTFADKPRRS